MGRAFNNRQRAALFIAQNGLCASCGVELKQGWHADHIYPWHAGGSTDVINGQALCPTCNLSKGGVIMGPRRNTLNPWSLKLLPWQDEAYTKYVTSYRNGKSNFLLVATPGAGKTIAAARLAHYHLTTGSASRIVIVVPSISLRTQWTVELGKIGINIRSKWENGDFILPNDYHGVTATYHQVASFPEFHRMFASQEPTMVIFDEIHHAGDENTWGGALLEAYECAKSRLLLSGTPFRSDNARIPWVEYENVDGQQTSKADFVYGYADGLRNHVVRPVFFPAVDANVHWMHGRDEKFATFNDNLPEYEAQQRLNAAISEGGQWMLDVLRDAHDRLTAMRQDNHPTAGGLVIAKSIEHAKGVEELLKKIGVNPTVVGNDDPQSSEKIEAFKTSRDEWIVSVRMVSEGVDIKRLRVLVYATNIVSELFFRQAMGRIVRKEARDRNEISYMYIPADSRLVEYAEKVKVERKHVFGDKDDEMAVEKNRDTPRQQQSKLFLAVSSDPNGKMVIGDGVFYDKAEVDFAETTIRKYDFPSHALGPFLQFARDNGYHPKPQPTTTVSSVETPVTTHDQRNRLLRKQVNRLVYQLATMWNPDERQRGCARIHGMLQDIDGCQLKEATENGLHQRIDLLESLISEQQRRAR